MAPPGSRPTSPELAEALKKQREGLSVSELDKRAEQLSKASNDASEIMAIRGEVAPEEQRARLNNLKTNLTSLVAKMVLRNVRVDGLVAHPENFATLSLGLKLDRRAEEASISKITELLEGTGLTCEEVQDPAFWNSIIRDGKQVAEIIRKDAESKSSKNTMEAIKQFAKKNPVAAALAGAGVAIAGGMFLSFLTTEMKDLFRSEKGANWKTRGGLMGTAGFLALCLLKGPEFMEWYEKLEMTQEAKEDVERAVKDGTGKVKEETRRAIEAGGEKAVEAFEGMGVDMETTIEADKEHPPSTLTFSEKDKEKAKYEMATSAFLRLYFFERDFGPDERRTFKQTINDLSDVPFSKIKSVYEANQSNQKVNPSELPGLSADISDELLFSLLEGLVKMSILTEAEQNPEISVYALFVSAGKHPALDQLDGLNGELVDKLKNLDFKGAIDVIGSQSVNLAENVVEFGGKLESQLDINIDHLSGEEKKAYREIQALLLTSSQVSQNPKEAVTNVIKPHQQYQSFPESISMAEVFFEKIKAKTPPILDKVYQHFALDDSGPLRRGVKIETLSFASACELIALEASFENSSETLTSLALLNAVLRAFDNLNDKNSYVGKLSAEVLTKEVSKIKLPGLQKVKAQFDKMAPLAGNALWNWLKDYVQIGYAFSEDNPTDLSGAEFAEQATQAPTISFGREAVGASLEIAGDSLASIVLTLGLEDWIGSCKTGEDFLEMIRVNGGNVAVTENRDGALEVIIEAGGKIFFARPGKIIGQSLYNGSLAGGRLGDGVKIWAVGSAPFVVYGAAKGFFRTVTVPGGRIRLAPISRIANSITGGLKGMTYPAVAGYKGVRAVGRVVRGVSTPRQNLRYLGEKIAQKPRRVYNWGRDIVRYRNRPFQNVDNLATSYRMLKRHYEAVKDLPIKSAGAMHDQWQITRDIRQGWASIRTDAEDIRHALTRQVTLPDTLRNRTLIHQTKKLAWETGKKLNSYFLYEKGEGHLMANLDHPEIKEIIESSERLKRFGEYSKVNPHLMREVKLLVKGRLSEVDEKIKDLLKTTGTLDAGEAKALARRIVKHPSTVEQIFKGAERAADQFVLSSEYLAKGPAAANTAKQNGPQNPIKSPITGIESLKPTDSRTIKEIKLNDEWVRVTEGPLAEERAMGRYMKVGSDRLIQEYKINGEWVRVADGPNALEEAKTKYMKQLKVNYTGTLRQFEVNGELIAVPEGPDAIEQAKKRYMDITRDNISISGKRITPGFNEFKINNEWIRVSEGEEALERAKRRYLKIVEQRTKISDVGKLREFKINDQLVRVSHGPDLHERAKRRYIKIEDSRKLREFKINDQWIKVTEGPEALKRAKTRYSKQVQVGSSRTLQEFKINDQWIKVTKGPDALERAQRRYLKINKVPQSPPKTPIKTASISRTKTAFGGKFGQMVQAPNGPTTTPAQTPEAKAAAKKGFEKAAKSAGVSIDVAAMKNPQLIAWFPVLKEMVGPASAVATIAYLETAEDKKKALAESAVGLAAFTGAQKGTFFTLGKINPAMVKSKLGLGISVVAGLGAAIGVTEPVAEILDEYIPKFVGDKQVYAEIASLTERILGYQAARGLLKPATKVALKEGLSVGAKSLAKVIPMKVRNSVGKRLAYLTGSSLSKKLAMTLGVRGTAMAATAASPIPGDEVAMLVIFGPWMAKDIYDIVSLSSKAYSISKAMDHYGKKEIEDIKPATEQDEKMFEATLAGLGMSEEAFAVLDEASKQNIFQSIPDITYKVKRSGESNYNETYRFVKGEVYSTTIVTPEGETVELSDEELNQDIKLPPPQELKKWDIDYKQAPDVLKANYRLAILMAKGECGWTKMDFDIRNDGEIVMKRLDGKKESLVLRRHGDKWSVGEYGDGYDLFQAIVLGNLINKVGGIIEKEGYRGGSERPFSITRNGIEFDKSWSAFNLGILSNEAGWLGFYDKIGLNQRDVMKALNAWYQVEHGKKALV